MYHVMEWTLSLCADEAYLLLELSEMKLSPLWSASVVSVRASVWRGLLNPHSLHTTTGLPTCEFKAVSILVAGVCLVQKCHCEYLWEPIEPTKLANAFTYW